MNNINLVRSILSNEKVDVDDEIIEFYRSNEGQVLKRKQIVLHYAFIYHKLDIVKLLTSVRNIDVNALYIKEFKYFENESKKQIESPMQLAIKSGDIRMIISYFQPKKY